MAVVALRVAVPVGVAMWLLLALAASTASDRARCDLPTIALHDTR